MATIYDVNPNELIEAVAKDLKENVKLEKPEWASFAKTGAHKVRQPEKDDWWWSRGASLLRKIYINGPVGVQRLRSAYGGKKKRGHKPPKFARAGGKVIRKLLQDFDALQFTVKVEKEGRKLTPKGQTYMNKIATDLLKSKNK